MDTVAVRYVGPFDEVEVPEADVRCKHGEAVEVPASVAGTAPVGTATHLNDAGEVVEASDDYDPGTGLLAQPTWEKATKKAAREDAAAHADDTQEG